jgi:hypothetical protein
MSAVADAVMERFVTEGAETFAEIDEPIATPEETVTVPFSA